MDQNNSPEIPKPEPDTLANPPQDEEATELTEEELESISGGTGTATPTLFHSTATGKHFAKGNLTV